MRFITCFSIRQHSKELIVLIKVQIFIIDIGEKIVWSEFHRIKYSIFFNYKIAYHDCWRTF